MKSNLAWWHGGSSQGKAGYYLRFDFDQDIIKALKDTIPWELREWNQETKTWWVDQRAEKSINDLFPGFMEQVASQMTLF